MDDQADRHGHDVGAAFDIFRQRYLITVLDFLAQDRRDIRDAARRAVDDIDAFGFQDCCKPCALLRPPPRIVFHRQPDE
jgi:hypothetical protein